MPQTHRRNSLYNDETWTDADGITWRVEEMTSSHRINLLFMLERRAESLRDAEAFAWYSYDGGEMAMMDAERAADEIMDMDPMEWLNEQPLIIKLRSLM